MKSRRVDYPVKPCVVCGKLFKPKTFKSEICSRNCRQRRDKGMLPLEEHLAKVRAEAKGRKESTCIHCGKVFTAKAGGWSIKKTPDKWGKYCSTQCRIDYKKANPDKRVYDFSPVRFAQCKVCGKWYVKRTPSPMCSDVCRRSWFISTQDRDRVSDRTIYCVVCGVWFSRLYKNSNTTCGHACRLELNKNIARDHKHKRRARIYEAGYERFDVKEIFDRDGWKCKACGRKTPKSKRSTTADNAPELDHIIPISRGGPHTRKNVQCLCRACNIAKGAGSLQDQMRLF